MFDYRAVMCVLGVIFFYKPFSFSFVGKVDLENMLLVVTCK